MPSGFGDPGGGSRKNRSSGKPLLPLRLTTTPPGPPKPPGNLGRVETPTRAISGGFLSLSAGAIFPGSSPGPSPSEKALYEDAL